MDRFQLPFPHLLLLPLSPPQDSDSFSHIVSDLRRCKTEEAFKLWKRRYHDTEAAGEAAAAAGGDSADGDEPSSPTTKRPPHSEPSSPARPATAAPFFAGLTTQNAAEALRLFETPLLYEGAPPAPVRCVEWQGMWSARSQLTTTPLFPFAGGKTWKSRVRGSFRPTRRIWCSLRCSSR